MFAGYYLQLWQACEEHTDTNTVMRMGRETLVLGIISIASVG